MNKSFLKFITDIGPLVIFFFFYYNNDKNLKIAIPPLIVATIIAVLIVWILEKKNSNGSTDKWSVNYIIWWSNYIF